METMTLTTIKKEVLVKASQQTAFNVFTQKMDAWWPRTHHVGSTPMVESVLEQKPGGRWYSRHEDGSEVNVGYILTWDPFGQVVLIWQIDGNFKCDPELVTEVEVNFIPDGPGTTRVTLEHRDLQKLAGGAKNVEAMDGGWGMIMELFKVVADAS